MPISGIFQFELEHGYYHQMFATCNQMFETNIFFGASTTRFSNKRNVPYYDSGVIDAYLGIVIKDNKCTIAFNTIVKISRKN